METAWAAQAETPARVSLSVEAKPQAPLARTRMPMPMDSDWARVPTAPFFVVRSRWRMCMERASAYVAPRSLAVSSAVDVKSHMVNAFQNRGGAQHEAPGNYCTLSKQD